MDGDELPVLRAEDPEAALDALKATIDSGMVHVVEVDGTLVACVPIVDISDARLLIEAVDTLAASTVMHSFLPEPRRARAPERAQRGQR